MQSIFLALFEGSGLYLLLLSQGIQRIWEDLLTYLFIQ